MELKKNPDVDIEKKRSALLWLGRILALGLVAIAFEYAVFPKENKMDMTLNLDMIEDELPPPSKEEVKPPPPPPPKPTTVIEIVEDDEEIEEELEVEEMEVDEETEIEIIEEVEEEVVEEEIFRVVEEMPGFPGGVEALYKFLSKEMKYPPMARDAGISGRVYVTFLVDKDGTIKNVEVLRGIGGGCDEEAIRVVKMMPKWISGKQRGKAVKVQFNLPVNFILK